MVVESRPEAALRAPLRSLFSGFLFRSGGRVVRGYGGCHHPLRGFEIDAGMMVAVEVDHSFDRAKSNLFATTVFAGHLDAFAVSEAEVGLGPLVETLQRARGGLDPNCIRCDLDHLVIADQQCSAAQVDARPYRRDAKKLVARPAETQGFVAMAAARKASRPRRAICQRSSDTSDGRASSAARKRATCSFERG